ALAEIFETAPLAGLGNLAFVTDHLRRGAQEGFLLRLEEFRIEIEPAGQARVVEWVRRRRDGAKRRGHNAPISSPRFRGEGDQRSWWRGSSRAGDAAILVTVYLYSETARMCSTAP